MGTLTPVPKVQAATLAGASTILAVYVLGLFGIHLPAEVASAMTTVFAFVAGYMQPDK